MDRRTFNKLTRVRPMFVAAAALCAFFGALVVALTLVSGNDGLVLFASTNFAGAVFVFVIAWSLSRNQEAAHRTHPKA